MEAIDTEYHLVGEYWYKELLLHETVPQEIFPRIESLPMYDGDVLVGTFPKSGTFWTSQIVWLIVNNADTRKANQKFCLDYIQHIEYLGPKYPNVEEKIQFLGNMSKPRVLRTHIPYSMIPIQAKNIKKVAVLRNPKDVMVSLYHFSKAFGPINYRGTWDNFFHTFLAGRVIFGDWFKHVLGWWAQREDPTLLIVFYEEMKKDHRGVVKKIAHFLQKELSNQQIDDIVEYTSFKNMHTNPGTSIAKNWPTEIFDEKISLFYRKGEIGDWKNYFTVAQNDHFNKVIATRLKDSSLTFDFDG